ncbi:MAG: hypothetical protein IPG59_04530 [Candidatus Melainabacteria bacterium]|nr:MAG: hypothetical protein IPG59_04530 [Candidatus Melainabacteria bacterium]
MCDIKDDSNIRWLNCNIENETNSVQLQLNFVGEREEDEVVDFEGELEVIDNGDDQDADDVDDFVG